MDEDAVVELQRVVLEGRTGEVHVVLYEDVHGGEFIRLEPVECELVRLDPREFVIQPGE